MGALGLLLPSLPPSSASLPHRTTCANRQCGVSYLELILVVLILAIIAIMALPNTALNTGKKLDLAAAEVAEAIRFARQEAMRTGVSKGIVFDVFNETVTIYSLPGLLPVYDVYDPVSKHLYTLNFKTDSDIAGVDLQSYSIYFTNSGINQAFLGFNKAGNPKTSFFGSDYMLNGTATITLSFADQTKVISIAPMTGRVSVQ